MRVIALSDTHLFRYDIPAGDVLIHAGDICQLGKPSEFTSEIVWLSKQPHKHKIYVPGNHDKIAYTESLWANEYCMQHGILMLVCKSIAIDDIVFHGDPWTPQFGWTKAFMHSREKAKAHWDYLPKADVLITHGPPAGILDSCPLPVGCDALFKAVCRTQPRIHLFGHIHTHGGGHRRTTWEAGNKTDFYNISMAENEWREIKPMEFDIYREGGKLIFNYI